MVQWSCSSASRNALHLSHSNKHTPWTETSKQAGRRSNWNLEQSPVTIIICIFIYEKRKESRRWPNTKTRQYSSLSLSQPDDTPNYGVWLAFPVATLSTIQSPQGCRSKPEFQKTRQVFGACSVLLRMNKSAQVGGAQAQHSTTK